MSKNYEKKTEAKQLVITNENAGRRIDNFLIRYFDKMPKSRIYQMLRKGEVRANRGRIKQTYRLLAGDSVRIPPVYTNEIEKSAPSRFLQEKMVNTTLYEDDGLIVMNKPSGIVVQLLDPCRFLISSSAEVSAFSISSPSCSSRLSKSTCRWR